MLTRIDLKGFKSFADQTTLEFGPGINVVVGPNGSGKSNLSEAVVWALGEQRAVQLRAGAMSDILYSGSEERKGAQIAQISLQFSPPETTPGAELEVSRRLTRAGDSDYAINGTDCRLLDVQDSLASRGLGPSSLAIIRQGKVEAICTSSARDRRAMLDEAAGVAAAKRRRRRAELKLSRLADQLERARDVEKELIGQARRLKRQASAAERAAALDTELAALRVTLRDARIARATEANAAAREAQQATAARVATAGTAMNTAREAQTAAEQERAGLAESANAAQQRALALRGAAERLGGRAELARERVGEAAERRKRLEVEREGARTRREAALARQEAAVTAEGEATAIAESAGAAVVAAEKAAEQQRAALSECRTRRDSAGVARQEAERALSGITAALERAEAAAVRGRAQLAEMPEGAVDELERAERRADIGARRIAAWSARVSEALGNAADAAAASDAADEARRRLEAELRLIEPSDTADAAVLGDGIDVDEGCEDAAAAALGLLADAVPVSDLAEGLDAISAGADAALVPAPAPVQAPAPAGARRLREVMRGTDATTEAYLDRLLSQAWLVDDLSMVPSDATGLWVTPEGRALRPGEGVLTGSRGSWLRRVRRRRLETALESARRECEVASAAREATAAVAARVDARSRAANRAASTSEQGLERVRASASGMAGRRQEAQDAIRASEEAHVAAAEDRARLTEERTVAQKAAAVADQEMEQARQMADRATGEWRAAQAKAVDADATLAAARTERAEIDARIGALEATIASGPGPEAPDVDGEGAVKALEDAASALGPHAEKARAAAQQIMASLGDGDERLKALRSATERASGVLEAARSAAQESEVSLAVAAERLTEAQRPPDGAAEGDEGQAPAEPFEFPEDMDLSDPEQLAERLADVERRRGSIGPVNLLAVEERVELEERAGELETQIADLEESASSLRGHLAELDNSVAEGFDAVFTQVSERFSQVVEQLFPGGKGRLTPVTDEDGEPGLEVEVIPHNKRARSLSLLSGGERSLVALGFCLALAMARPAPFYLLDEVEAALDDVNLRRFLGVVRSLAKETQFVLITHQQPTVEIADTIFGVTMGRDGASQIVSRRLEKDVEGPARRFVRRELHAVPGGA